MIFRRIATALLAATAVLTIGCRSAPTEPPSAAVGVTNPYLGSLAHWLLGEQTETVSLVGPGMCPGHFDVRPSQVRQLRKCCLIVRFDFQDALQRRLATRLADGPPWTAVAPPGGLCEPDTFQAVGEQLADVLVAQGLLSQPDADRGLAALRSELATLREDIAGRIAAAGLSAPAVVASEHQARFCRWLGLKVIATFGGADVAGVDDVDRPVRAGRAGGAQLVIANRPEGRRLADRIAEGLSAPVVVFDNFPPDEALDAFGRLVRANVAALIEAGDHP